MADQPDLSTLAGRLRSAREKGGIKQRRLCQLSRALGEGVSTSYVSMLELGQRTNPEVEKLGQIAAVLGVSVDWLAFGRGPAPSAKRIRAAVETAKAKADGQASVEASP